MNDTDECNAGFEIAKSLLASDNEALEILESVKNNVTEASSLLLSASFSYNPNNQKLWREYASDEGVALAFDRNEITQASLFNRYSEKMAPIVGTPQVFNVVYDESLAKKNLTSYLDRLPAKSCCTYPSMLKLLLMRWCYTYKTERWSDEEEVRVVAEVMEGLDSYTIKTHPNKRNEGKDIYHYALPIAFRGHSYIKHAILGKCSNLADFFKEKDITYTPAETNPS